EVQRQIIDEGLIPEPIQIETGDIAAALRLTYPEQLGGLAISPSWFTSGDFRGGGVPEWSSALAAAKDRENTARGRLWQLLSDEQRQTITRLNKLLIAAAFPTSLHKARLNLMSLFSWRPVKVRFQVLNAQEAFMIWMKAALVTGLV